MGFKLFSDSPSAPQCSPNPNPHRFKVQNVISHYGYYLSEVIYPDCTTFEGRKVLLTNFDPRTRKVLDPHFGKDSGIIARFEPTNIGWSAGRMLLYGQVA